MEKAQNIGSERALKARWLESMVTSTELGEVEFGVL